MALPGICISGVKIKASDVTTSAMVPKMIVLIVVRKEMRVRDIVSLAATDMSRKVQKKNV